MGDFVLDQVVASFFPTPSLAKFGASGRSDNGSAKFNDSRDVVPRGQFDFFSAVYQTLVALFDDANVGRAVNAHSDDSSDGRIHSLGVATRGQHGDCLPDAKFFSFDISKNS